jgi:serine/threonine protein kinase
MPLQRHSDVPWEEVALALARIHELEADDRPAALAQLDPAVRLSVEWLLLALDRSPDFLEHGHRLLTEPGPLVGRQFGKYRVIRELGSGGFGTVFLGERDDEQFRKQVAIRVIPSLFLSADELRLLEFERQALASLEHPHIARLIDAGATSSEYYLVMEYVDGQLLLDTTRAASEAEKLRLFQQVCAAVSCSHAHLIVHRDIKPANVMVTGGGQAKLLDFGIARALPREGDDRTLTQAPTFTLDYASPEQVLGRRATTASDVYALGVMLYELLSGTRPRTFRGRSWDAVVAAMTEDCDCSALTGDRRAICEKATRADPSARYASVAALSADIDNYVSGLPVIARAADGAIAPGSSSTGASGRCSRLASGASPSQSPSSPSSPNRGWRRGASSRSAASREPCWWRAGKAARPQRQRRLPPGNDRGGSPVPGQRLQRGARRYGADAGAWAGVSPARTPSAG